MTSTCMYTLPTAGGRRRPGPGHRLAPGWSVQQCMMSPKFSQQLQFLHHPGTIGTLEQHGNGGCHGSCGHCANHSWNIWIFYYLNNICELLIWRKWSVATAYKSFILGVVLLIVSTFTSCLSHLYSSQRNWSSLLLPDWRECEWCRDAWLDDQLLIWAANMQHSITSDWHLNCY